MPKNTKKYKCLENESETFLCCRFLHALTDSYGSNGQQRWLYRQKRVDGYNWCYNQLQKNHKHPDGKCMDWFSQECQSRSIPTAFTTLAATYKLRCDEGDVKLVVFRSKNCNYQFQENKSKSCSIANNLVAQSIGWNVTDEVNAKVQYNIPKYQHCICKTGQKENSPVVWYHWWISWSFKWLRLV